MDQITRTFGFDFLGKLLVLGEEGQDVCMLGRDVVPSVGEQKLHFVKLCCRTIISHSYNNHWGLAYCCLNIVLA